MAEMNCRKVIKAGSDVGRSAMFGSFKKSSLSGLISACHSLGKER